MTESIVAIIGNDEDGTRWVIHEDQTGAFICSYDPVTGICRGLPPAPENPEDPLR